MAGNTLGDGIAGKRVPACIVPKKSHSTAARQSIEQKPRGGHIRGMTTKPEKPAEAPADASKGKPAEPAPRPREIGGPKGPEPTRYGDWEVGGRCTDF